MAGKEGRAKGARGRENAVMIHINILKHYNIHNTLTINGLD